MIIYSKPKSIRDMAKTPKDSLPGTPLMSSISHWICHAFRPWIGKSWLNSRGWKTGWNGETLGSNSHGGVFQALAGNGQIWRNPSHSAPSTVSLESLEERTVPALINWDGGAGTFNWADADNWDTNQLPGSGDQVNIPDLTGNPVISVNTNVNIESIQCAEGLRIQDFNLSLTKGPSQINGPFSMKNGNLSVVGDSSTLTISSTEEILGSNLFASTGAKINLPGLTTATNIRLSAEGAGTLISLPSLTEIKSNYAATGYFASVFARFGGTIDLPNLKGITFATPSDTISYDEAGIVVWDTDSSINLPQLSDLSGVDTIRAEYGGSLSLPSVTTWAPQMANRPTGRTLDVSVYNPYETKSVLSFPNLSMIEAKSGSFYFNANGNATIGLPVLASATENGGNISFTLIGSNSSIKLPGLTSVSSFDFSLQGGKNTLELPNVTTANQANFYIYDYSLNLPVLSSANGAIFNINSASTLDVPTLTSANGADFALGGGSKIDLVGLTTPTNLRLTADGPGSLISLPNVTKINSNYAESPYASRLYVRMGGTIDLPKLVAISFATPDATTSYDETDILVQDINSSLNLAKLADLSGVDTIRVESGGSLSLPSVTTWAPQMVNRPSWRGLNIAAYNTGQSPTELNFPNLTTMEAKAGSFYLNATGYSSIGLPVLSKATENGGDISFYLSGQKASIKLPGITSVNFFDFTLIGGKNTIDLPNVVSANQASFTLTDYSLTLPALVNANQSRFTAYSQSTLDVPLLTSADGADFGFNSGSKTNLVGLTTPTNLRLSADGTGTQIALPNATLIKSNYAVAPNTARLVARVGGLLDLPNLTGITFATPVDTTSYDEADILVQDLGSSINVPKVADLSGVDSIRAESGGSISFPSVSAIAYQMANRPAYRSWDVATYEPANVNGQGALISFPNLSTIEAKAGSFTYNATGKSTIDLPKLIMATESGGDVRFNATGRDASIKLPLLDTANGAEFTLYDRASLSLPKLAGIKMATFSTYSGSMLHLDALVSGTNVRFHSENLGSTIALPVLTSLKNDSSLANELALEAIGGAIDLPALTSIVREGTSFYGGDIRVSATGTIQAPLLSDITGIDFIQTSQGAKLSLPTVTKWTTPNFDSYETVLYSDDPGSLLELPNLTSITHADTQGYQFLVSGRNGGMVSLPKLETFSKSAAGIININAEGGGHLELPQLSSATKLTFNFSGLQSSVNLAKLETANQSTFNASGGFSLNLPGLLSATSSTFISQSASSILANALTTATNLSLRAENTGSVISLSSLASMKRDGNLPLEVNFEAINGTIQLPGLTSISRVGTSFHGGDINVAEKGTIQAPLLADLSGIDSIHTYHGGKLSLPGMVTWVTPNFDSNETDLISNDPGSLLEFPNLTSIVHANTQANQFLLYCYNGGTLSFPKLTTLSKTGMGPVNLNLESGKLNLPSLVSMGMMAFSLSGNGGSIDLGKLESVNQTTFNTHGGFVLNLPSLVSAKSANFKAFSGSEVFAGGLIAATNIRLRADGAGSAIGMSKLTTLNRDSSLPEDLAIEAIGGTIDLPSLTTTTRVGQSAGAGYFQVQGIGVLSAPVLADLSGIDVIQVYQRGHLSLPGVTSWTTPNFDSNPINLYSDDSGSLLEFPNLTSIKHANPLNNPFGLNARSGGTMEFPNLVSVVDSSAGRIAFISQIAEQISIPLLIDKSGIEFEFTGGFVSPTITWTGMAGNFNFTDAANWDQMRIPGGSDEVIIPNLPGDQIITINENASIRSIVNAEGLLIPKDRYLDLTAGKSQISGEFKIDQGNLRLYSGAQFTASNTVNLTAANLEAQAGSKIIISGLTTATNLGLNSSGKGSSIALTNLITIQRDPNLGNEVTLNALGGTISLPALTGITRVGNSFYGGDIRIQGTGALHVPVLSDLSGIDFLNVTSGGKASFPSVTTWSTPAFDSYETVLYADDTGSRLEFPNLAKVTHADTQGYQLRFGARNGGTLSLPKLTIIVRGTTAPIYLSAESGGRLEVPALESSTGLGFNFAGVASSADLSKVASANQASFSVSDQFPLELPALTESKGSEFLAYYGASVTVGELTTATNLRLRSEAGAVISLAKLATLNRDANSSVNGNLEVYNGTINLPSLTSFARVDKAFYGSLIAIQGTGKLNAPALAQISGVDTINVSYGGQLSLPGVVTWKTPDYDSYATTLTSQTPGSLIEFPNLTSFAHADTVGYGFSLQATNGGIISMPKLASLTRETAAPIDLRIDSGGSIKLPSLISANGVNFTLSQLNSSINLVKLASINQSIIYTYDNFYLNLPVIASANKATFNAYSGSKVQVATLATALNLRLHAENPWTSITFADLKTLQANNNETNTLLLDVYNASIQLPALTDIVRVGNSYGGGTINVIGSGTIQAPLLASLTGIERFETGGGGKLSLPGITTWTTPDFDCYQTVLYSSGWESSLEFPNLTSIHHLDRQGGFYISPYTLGKISLPSLTSLTKDGNASKYSFDVEYGGNLQMPVLATANQATFYLRGANSTINLDKLASSNKSTFSITEGFTLNLPSLVSPDSSTFTAYSGSKVTMAGLQGAKNLNLNAYSGSTFSLPEVKTLQRDSTIPNYVILNADNSLIEMPSLTSFVDGKYEGGSYISASSQGIIRLGSSGKTLDIGNVNIYAGDQTAKGWVLLNGGSINGPEMGSGKLNLLGTGSYSGPRFQTKGQVALSDNADWRMATDVQLDDAASLNLAKTALFRVTGLLTGSTTNATDFRGGGTLKFEGQGSKGNPQILEAMSEDLGYLYPENNQNFSLNKLELSAGTYLKLQEKSNNSAGTGAEAIYLESLVVPSGCTLDLNGVQVYSKSLDVQGTILGIVAPTINSDNKATNTYGSTANFTVQVTSNPGVTKFELNGAVPSGVTINPLNGRVTLGPKVSAGSYTFQIIASNNLAPAATQDFTLTVNPAALTILAEDKSKVYGDPQPSFTTKVTGLVNNEKESDITGLGVTTLATASSSVGTYALKPKGTINNYSITYIDGTLNVTKAALSITAEDKSKIYGDALPALTTKIVGLVNGDKDSDLSGLGVSTTATLLSPAGKYELVPAGTNPNYEITLVKGLLTVNKALQKILWSNPATITYGTKLDSTQLNATVSGVDGGTDPGSLTYAPQSGVLLNAGTRTLIVTAAETANYLETTKSVSLIVEKAQQQITWDKPGDIIYGIKLTTSQLNATVKGVQGGTDPGSLTYDPSVGALLNAGTRTLTVFAAETDNYLAGSKSVTLIVNKAQQTITWDKPGDITYGTKLGATQLNASVAGVQEGSAPGSLTYDPKSDEILKAGSRTLTVTASATDNYLEASKSVILIVNKAQQTIKWENPNDITYGTKLTDAQLNATVSGVDGGSAAGPLTYDPQSGEIIDAGSRTLTVKAGETENYLEGKRSVTLIVTKAKQTISWNKPADINYGTKLGATQLNAKAMGVEGGSAAGALTYDPKEGDLLNTGTFTLTVSAAETINYLAASQSVPLVVQKGLQTITWKNPENITYGTKLSNTQLNATVAGADGGSAPGSLTYGQALGDLLNAGTTTLMVTAAETDNYLAATKSVMLGVDKARQTISWNNPDNITYGTKLGSSQLNASVAGVEGGSAPGSLTYGQAIGDLLNAGSRTLTVSAGGTDNYLPESKSVTLNVKKANQTIGWKNPDSITYGTKLGATQLNATASGVEGGSAPGSLTYDPVAGTLLDASSRTLTVSVGETDNYLEAIQSVTLLVQKGQQTIFWAKPDAIPVGTKLSATQLNATVTGVEGGSQHGALTYNRSVGDLLPAGAQSLKVIASETDNYLSATKTVILDVVEGPVFSSANKATFEVGKAGTFTVVATGFPLPAFALKTSSLPDGITLSSAGVLSGTAKAGTGKTYPFTISATNGVGTEATQSFTLTINQTPAITSANKASFEIGKAGSFTVAATGFPAATFALKSGTLPDGVTLSSAGLLSGTPKAGTAKNHTFTISATNGVGTAATQDFTLSVTLAPAISSTNKATFEVGKASSFTVVATGFPAPTFTLKTGTLPDGLILSSAGILSGTPKAGTGKNYSVTISASNGVGPGATQDFTVTVNQAPAITSTNKATFEVGKASSFSVVATGFPAPTFTVKTGTLPDGLTLNSAGILSGTPKAGTGKNYSVTISASNGVGTGATQDFTLTVNQAPAISSTNKATFEVGKGSTFTVVASGFPAPAFSLKTGTLPDGVTLSSAGVLSGTPRAGMGKNYTLTISASNGVGSAANQDFTLTVNQVPAITSPNKATFEAGKAGSFTVTATGFPVPTFSLKTGTLPDGLTLSSAGILTGTPKAGTGKNYTLTLSASNGIGSDSAQDFTLTVNEAAAFTSPNKFGFEAGKAGAFQMAASGFPAPAFQLIAGTLPSGVTLTSSGQLSGTPAAGTSKVFAFTVSAANGIGGSATQDFQLTVGSLPSITSANKATFQVGKASSFAFTAKGSPVPTFSVTSGDLPVGLTLTSAGILSGTPAAGTGNAYSLTITASNGIGSGASQAFTLTVNQAPAFTNANNTAFEVSKSGQFSFTASGFPAATFKITTGVLPSGVVLSPGGKLSGTPIPGTAKAYSLIVTASNGIGTAATQAFTLTVGQPPAITSTNKTSFEVGKSGTFQLTATGFPAPTYALTEGTLPSGVTFSSAGLLSGKPGNATGKTYSLTISASNGFGNPATQSFTLTVNQAPAFTSANSITLDAGEAASFDVMASGFPVPTLSLASGILPGGLTFDAKTGRLSGIPAFNNPPGTYSLAFKATNGVGTAVSQTFSLILNNPIFTYIPEGTLPILTTTNGAANGVTIWGANGIKLGSINPYPGFSGRIFTTLADINGDNVVDIITSPGLGLAPTVKIFDGRLLGQILSFNAYDAKFTGGVNVAVGDLDGDGILDLVTSPGKGTAPLVKIFQTDGKLKTSFNAYATTNTNGLNVMVADLDLNGKSEILTIPASPSSSQLKLFDSKGTLQTTIQAYESSFTGGLSVSLGDVDGNRGLEIVTTSGPGRTTTTRVFSSTGALQKEWTPVSGLTKGGTVVVGDLTGDQKAEIIFATSSGVSPTLQIFDNTGKSLAKIAPYSTFTGGVNIALVDIDGNGIKEIVTAPGIGLAPLVKRFNDKLELLDSLFATTNTFTGGIFLS